MWYTQSDNNVEIVSDFQAKVMDESRPIAIYGAVPPPKRLSEEKMLSCAQNVAQTIRELNPDGVIIYDIQDEKSRSGEERPFPFFETHESRQYGKIISEQTHTDVIVYQAINENLNEQTFNEYLTETREKYNLRTLVFVGGSSSARSLLSVAEASRITKEHVFFDYFLGGITIPERHRDRGDEHFRLMEKFNNGISFFTSQVVYNADNAIWMLREYDELCKVRGKKPARIIFAFAPFGRESTVNFLRWLGVELPEGTVKRVLSRKTSEKRVQESIQICWENFRRILDAARRLELDVPVGIAVESVSKYKDEQLGASQLFTTLREELNAHYGVSSN